MILWPCSASGSERGGAGSRAPPSKSGGCPGRSPTGRARPPKRVGRSNGPAAKFWLREGGTPIRAQRDEATYSGANGGDRGAGRSARAAPPAHVGAQTRTRASGRRLLRQPGGFEGILNPPTDRTLDQ
jgi:hypothetical protein